MGVHEAVENSLQWVRQVKDWDLKHKGWLLIGSGSKDQAGA